MKITRSPHSDPTESTDPISRRPPHKKRDTLLSPPLPLSRDDGSKRRRRRHRHETKAASRFLRACASASASNSARSLSRSLRSSFLEAGDCGRGNKWKTDRPNVARVVCERPMDDPFFALHYFHRPRTVTMTLALSSYRAGNSRISSRPVSMQERLHSAPLERGGGGRVAGDGDAHGAMRPIRK